MNLIQRDVQGVAVLDLVGKLTSSEGVGKLGGRLPRWWRMVRLRWC
jgi:hypothetical protein